MVRTQTLLFRLYPHELLHVWAHLLAKVGQPFLVQTWQFSYSDSQQNKNVSLTSTELCCEISTMFRSKSPLGKGVWGKILSGGRGTTPISVWYNNMFIVIYLCMLLFNASTPLAEENISNKFHEIA